MKTELFNVILKKQIDRINELVVTKAQEYATDDRLHNFKVAAELQNCTMDQALAGMMAKHTVSIYDMCNTDKPSPLEMWDEKITDHIIYLILLRAVVEEQAVNNIQKLLEEENLLNEKMVTSNAE